MKTLLPLTLAALTLFAVGCESTDSSETTKPAAQTGSTAPAPVQYQMTDSEKRVMEMQALDREYSDGGMPTNVYFMRQQQILDSY